MTKDDLFNFEIIPVTYKLEMGNYEFISVGLWDNLFYQGMFLEKEKHLIHCISPCCNCYHSWFNINFSDFYNNKLYQLVQNNFLTNEIIKEKRIADVSTFGNSFSYKTKIGAPANYVQVKCKSCNTKHLMILGFSEMQPALYRGQLHGVWRIKE